MTTDEQHVRNGQAFFDAIRADNAWSEAAAFRPPRWLHEVGSSVALAAVGEDVEYVTLGGTREGRFDLNGVAFTQSRMIRFAAKAEFHSDDAEIEVVARGLKDLTEIGVHARVPLGATEGVMQWPGAPSAQLRFRDGFSISIPATQVWLEPDRDALAALIQRLPSFLA